MFIREHNLDHGVDIKVLTVCRVKVWIWFGFVQEIMNETACSKYLETFLLFGFEQSLIIFKVYIAIRFHASDPESHLRGSFLRLNLIVKVAELLLGQEIVIFLTSYIKIIGISWGALRLGASDAQGSLGLLRNHSISKLWI